MYLCPINMQNDIKRIKILTFNAGLLDVRIFGFVVFSNPAHSETRLPYLAASLRSTDADILCLQEVYTTAQISLITDTLKDVYPFSAHSFSSGIKLVQNGLLILSRWPILSQHLRRFTVSSFVEDWIANKSILSATIDVPGVGLVTVLTCHTTAGGEVADSADPSVDKLRQPELQEVADLAKEASKRGELVIIAGDLNCGPDASVGNYMSLLVWSRDVFEEARQVDKICDSNLQNLWTWDPTIYLNSSNVHRASPGNRVDHCLLATFPSTTASGNLSISWSAWRANSGKILFKDPCATVKDGASVKHAITLSDHYGLLVEIERD